MHKIIHTRMDIARTSPPSNRSESKFCEACRRLGHWVIAEIEYTSEFYSCLGENEYHYFCREHIWKVKCPIHRDGRVLCEVRGCYEKAKKYSHKTYDCLSVGEYHFFCQYHARGTCRIHPQLYSRN